MQDAGVDIRVLVPGEAGKVHRLMSDTITSGYADFYSPSDVSYYESVLDGTGVILGAFVQDNLVGYAVLEFSGIGDDNFGYLVDVPKHEYLRVALLAGCMVDPVYRGRGIQSALIYARMREAVAYGCRYFFATVHAQNERSASNLQKAGLRVVAKDLQVPWGTRDIWFIEHKSDVV